ncbi:hypothetical protein A3F32_02755 [Candidatus Roizmanbacteria bacterium RIFCSPHIGHO2_12_FULL_42_10]|nr:MAG: hypothetical protein A3F32_02755 [Candidatus Roizmanbacteria bacterium RIFCSPHIGHO2_12_FULL_42_10]
MLEVVMFTAILTTVMLAIVFATTQSLKQTIYSQRKILSTHAAEELQEWMRGEKENDWATFSARSGTFCFNEDIATCDASGTCWDSNQACEADDYSLQNFKREAVLTVNGSRIDVSISVFWKDGPNVFEVPLITTFSRWE